MGTSKIELFSKADNELATLAKAMGHPARVAILRHLARLNGCVCGDLVDELPLSQSTISQHLKALKEAGLIKGEISGKHVCYCIDPNTIQKTQQLLGAFFNKCC